MVASEQEFLHSVNVVDLTVIGLFRQVDYLQNFISIRAMKSDIYILLNSPKLLRCTLGIMMGRLSLKMEKQAV